MAGVVDRLGTLLTSAEDDLLAAVALLASVASPRGHERRLARAVADFGRERWPAARWVVQEVDGDECAQVVATSGDEPGGLLLYSHLDTSLTGDAAFDLDITGHPPAPPGADVDLSARTLRGFGLGVAKAPAAAALVAFGTASAQLADRPHGLRLLLAARGTHRAEHDRGEHARTGMERYLEDADPPAAAIVAKGGPAGVLFDEPGAAYVRVTARAGWGAVIAQAHVQPPGGVLARLGDVLDAVRAAGDRVVAGLADAAGGGQAGACFGIGAVRSGQPTKADLVPGLVTVHGYLVAPGRLDAVSLGAILTTAVRERLAAAGDVEVDVEVDVIHDGAATSASSPVVAAAVAAWRHEQAEHDVLAAPATITGWTGSTDGVVLRAAGIPTVRLGPSRTRPTADGTDVVDLDELLAVTRIYQHLALSPR